MKLTPEEEKALERLMCFGARSIIEINHTTKKKLRKPGSFYQRNYVEEQETLLLYEVSLKFDDVQKGLYTITYCDEDVIYSNVYALFEKYTKTNRGWREFEIDFDFEILGDKEVRIDCLGYSLNHKEQSTFEQVKK